MGWLGLLGVLAVVFGRSDLLGSVILRVVGLSWWLLFIVEPPLHRIRPSLCSPFPSGVYLFDIGLPSLPSLIRRFIADTLIGLASSPLASRNDCAHRGLGVQAALCPVIGRILGLLCIPIRNVAFIGLLGFGGRRSSIPARITLLRLGLVLGICIPFIFP